MKLAHGWAFPDEDRFMAAELGPDGLYQFGHLTAALERVTAFGVALDGGAHVGTWSRVLAGRFEQVLAFEPAPDTFACLARNVAAFGLANVEIRQAALGDAPGRVRVTLDGFERAIAMGNTGARFVSDGDDADRITIDSLGLDRLDFLKLDIEGSEPAAIRGAEATIRRCRPVVLYEDKGLCRRYGERPDACHRLLAGLGMVRAVKVGTDAIYVWP